MITDIKFTFLNEYQKKFFFATERNQCFGGGFGNGKTYVGCEKSNFLLLKFPRYRTAIVRKSFKDLKNTTMQTFLKQIPPNILSRHSEIEGISDFVNGSRIYWLHSDKFDEGTLRGLEINSALIDQAEEIDESIYLILDSRIGRWDGAIVPDDLLTPNWPRNPKTGKPRVPNYHMILCNPEHTLHWIYERYHPESNQRRPDHYFINAPTDPSAYDPLTYQQMLSRDPEWVAKYVRGEWGVSDASIHNILQDSILKDPPEEWYKEFLKKASLWRILDHGDASPTCCLWWGCWKGLHICYREYYIPHDVISKHRKHIAELSADEYYNGNFADPSIFKKASQKDGGFWSVADEYADRRIGDSPIIWNPADNNEFSTRNRINEFLIRHPLAVHPITGVSPAPRLYFIQRSENYPNGVVHAIKETQSQRRENLGTYNGKTIYSDDREKSISDHAYDCVRYYVSQHGVEKAAPKRKASPNSFLALRKTLKKLEYIQ